MLSGEFHVVVRCPSCGVQTDAWLDEVPALDSAIFDDPTTEEIVVECERCGCEIDMTIAVRDAGWIAFQTNDPNVTATVERLDYTYDDWLEEMEPEPHPRRIFNEAITDWTALLNTIADQTSGKAGTNRMLLVQLFSITEAYLSDAVVKLVSDYPAIARSIVEWHADLKDERVSLVRVASEPTLVRDMVVAQLRKTQFHRFEFLNGLLRAAIDHQLLPKDKAERDFVLRSVHLRHDCVHRNGRDIDGNILDTMTVEYLRDLAICFMDIVSRLAATIDKMKAKRDLDELMGKS